MLCSRVIFQELNGLADWSPFESFFAPPVLVEPDFGRLTVESPPLVEDMIHIRCRKAPKPAIVVVHRSDSSFDEVAAVAAGL
jgi:hypothetical protein